MAEAAELLLRALRAAQVRTPEEKTTAAGRSWRAARAAVRAGAVLPLLWLAQRPRRSAALGFAPAADADPAEVRAADAALAVLAALADVAEGARNEAGWRFVRPGATLGSAVYARRKGGADSGGGARSDTGPHSTGGVGIRGVGADGGASAEIGGVAGGDAQRTADQTASKDAATPAHAAAPGDGVGAGGAGGAGSATGEVEAPVPLAGQGWEGELLQRLSMLVLPGDDGKGNERWAARVVYCSGVEAALTRAAEVVAASGGSGAGGDEGEGAGEGGVAVVDVLLVDDAGSHTFMRQLVVGAWHGPETDVRAEADMSLVAGTTLETWVDTALCAFGVMGMAGAVAAERAPRVLLLGCGGCTVASFLATYAPHAEIDIVEPRADVVAVARTFFGLSGDVQVGDAAVAAAESDIASALGHRAGEVGAPGSQPAFTAHASKSVAPRRRAALFRRAANGGDGQAARSGTTRIFVGDLAATRPALGSYESIVVDAGAPADCVTPEGLRALWECLSDGAKGVLAVRSRRSIDSTMHAESSAVGKALQGALARAADVVCTAEHYLREPDTESSPDEPCVFVAGAGAHLSATGWAALVDGGATDADGAAGRVAPPAMEVALAQRTSAVRLPALLSPEEISAVHAIAEEVAATGAVGTEVRSSESDAWRVLYLHTGGLFSQRLPGLQEKLLAAVQRVDAAQGWGLVSGDGAAGPVNVRVAEYHRQTAPGPGLPDPRHYDQDSLVTIDVMLSEPGVDFEGGEFQTLEAAAEGGGAPTLKRDYEFRQGDATVFVAHKYHCVAPVVSGCRRVLVLEFWRGEARQCPHRCLSLAECVLDAAAKRSDRPAVASSGAAAAVDAPRPPSRMLPLPFRLGSVSAEAAPPAAGSVPLKRLLWQENTAASNAAKAPVVFLEEDDDAWGVFD